MKRVKVVQKVVGERNENVCINTMYCIATNQPAGLNSAQMREIEALIDVDRRKLQEEKGMAEGERNALEAKLKQREDDLNKARFATNKSVANHMLQ